MFSQILCHQILTWRKRRSAANSLSNGARLFFSFFFASTCIGQKKKRHVAKPWVEMTRLLLLLATRFFGCNAALLLYRFYRVDLNWNGVVVCVSFLQMNTQMLNVSETLCRAKIEDVRGCADEWAFSLYVYMHALRARVCMYACVRVQYMCKIRKQVWWRFNCLNLDVLQKILNGLWLNVVDSVLSAEIE